MIVVKAKRFKGVLILSILIYLIVQVAVYLRYAFDPLLLPTDTKEVAIRFSGFAYLWLFMVTTFMWHAANVAAAAWDEFGPE